MKEYIHLSIDCKRNDPGGSKTDRRKWVLEGLTARGGGRHPSQRICWNCVQFV